MKKILVAYIMDGKAGGIDRYLLNVFEQSKGEFKIDFLTNKVRIDLKKYLEENGSNLFEVPNLNHPISQFKKIKDIIKSNNYDMVYFNISTAIMFPGVLAAKTAQVKKIIIHSHSAGFDCVNKYKRKTFEFAHKICSKFLYKFGTDFYACSKPAGEWMFPKKIVNSNQFKVINNAIDTEKFAFNPKKRISVRQKLGLENFFVIGHMGNFLYVKNHKFLIELFKQYLDFNNMAKLILVGDGPLELEIKQMAIDYKIQDKVIFAGRQSNNQDYFQAMDIFLLPSHFEGFGIVALEAQCSGLPCIISDSVPNQVAVTEKCKFISIDDKEKWVKAIIDFENYKREDGSKLLLEAGFELKNQNIKTILS